MSEKILNTVYTFWEPRNKMPAYLQLCMDTWKTHLSDLNLVIIDYSNLHNFIPSDSINIENLKRFPLLVQKDGILSAVMKFNGGMFIDADMILSGRISDILIHLNNFDMVTFDHHLSFVAVKAGTLLINEWYEEVLRRINHLETGDAIANWDYLGNAIANRKLKKFRKYRVKVIDKYSTAFTAETLHFPNSMDEILQYSRFWFSESIKTDKVFYHNQVIIDLHNSWTPDWFTKLTREEVLNHPCLLSRTLRLLLSADGESLKRNHVSFLVYLNV